MFGNADEPDEERLECMVKLLQTCGKKLDQTGSPETQKVTFGAQTTCVRSLFFDAHTSSKIKHTSLMRSVGLG